jgi:hypothetical protein
MFKFNKNIILTKPQGTTALIDSDVMGQDGSKLSLIPCEASHPGPVILIGVTNAVV